MNKCPTERSLQSRLDLLQEKIIAAETRLLGLSAALEAAQSEDGLKALARTLAENKRLRDANEAAELNISDVTHALEAAVKESRTDPLTGLLNRLTLWDRLGHEIERAKRGNSVVAVYFLDIDSFKAINDTYGHAVGDRLLQHVAHELANSVRASDSVCRIGGDEFAVVFSAKTSEDVGVMTRKLKSALTQAFYLDDKALSYSVSCGCSVYPIDSSSPSALLELADERMYQDKRLRSNGPG